MLTRQSLARAGARASRHRKVCPSICMPMTRSYLRRGERHGAHAQVLEAHLREQLGDDALQGARLIICTLLCASCHLTPYARLPEIELSLFEHWGHVAWCSADA